MAGLYKLILVVLLYRYSKAFFARLLAMQ